MADKDIENNIQEMINNAVRQQTADILTTATKTMDLVNSQQNLDVIGAIMQLLDHKNIRMTTEFPNANYVKEIVKLETLRSHQATVFHLNINNGFSEEDFVKDDDKILKPMIYHFILAMISHKRKRAQEVVKPLAREPIAFYGEQRSKKSKFFGV